MGSVFKVGKVKMHMSLTQVNIVVKASFFKNLQM